MTKLRLVTIGDSLTQGFQSGAIHNTGWSFPTIIARALGLEVPLDFRVPRIPGPGHPLNLEDLLQVMERDVGDAISGAEWIFHVPRLVSDYLDEVEDYYERGGGSLPGKFGGIYHNLAVWGFTVNESMTLTPELCDKAIEDEEGWIEDDFLGIPSGSMYRTARRVLNPANDPKRRKTTQTGCLKRLADDEGIDVLTLLLGANDCLGTVLTLEIEDMEEEGGPIPQNPLERLQWNLTSAKQFDTDYRRLAKAVASALTGQPTKVFVGTVPHVTIPPLTRGVGNFDGTYFDYYGRFFMTHETFNPVLHKHLTRQDAQRIDGRIDAFNETIRAVAREYGWNLVDLCAVLDKLAVRRNRLEGDPGEALRQYYADLGITDHPLLNLSPIPSILMLKLDAGGKRTGGGLFSLDGIHPSTIGYGIVAEAFLRTMQQAGVPSADANRLPWTEVIANDALLQVPPKLWDDVSSAAMHHSTLWDLIFRVLS